MYAYLFVREITLAPYLRFKGVQRYIKKAREEFLISRWSLQLDPLRLLLVITGRRDRERVYARIRYRRLVDGIQRSFIRWYKGRVALACVIISNGIEDELRSKVNFLSDSKDELHLRSYFRKLNQYEYRILESLANRCVYVEKSRFKKIAWEKD